MGKSDEIRRVTVVGTGLVGGSWAALFLANGLEVTATDPAPNARDKLFESVARAWPVLVQLGLVKKDAWHDRLHFTADLKEGLADTDYVQECAPEREDLKIKLFTSLGDLAPAEVILASSSSGLMMSAVQSQCRHPERCVIGHPINPPHVIPLVEVLGGDRTSPETIDRAMKFYVQVGKHPIYIRKEVRGYVANRLQAALWREALHLVSIGAITVADADAAVSQGIGLRWAIMGPSLVWHLSGGPGGIQHFMDHLAGPFARWWPDLGSPALTPELIQAVIQGVAEEANGRSVADLERERDRVLLGLLALLKKSPTAGSAA